MPTSPAQCEAAGAAAAIRTAPVTAAAVLPVWFCKALAIGDGLRCRAAAGRLAAACFDLRCLADLLDKARPPVGRSRCARWSPAAPAVTAIGGVRAPCKSAAGNTDWLAARTVGCWSPRCIPEGLSQA